MLFIILEQIGVSCESVEVHPIKIFSSCVVSRYATNEGEFGLWILNKYPLLLQIAEVTFEIVFIVPVQSYTNHVNPRNVRAVCVLVTIVSSLIEKSSMIDTPQSFC